MKQLSKTEILRDERYVFNKNYNILKGLAELFKSTETESKHIVKYMLKHDLDINSQIPTGSNGVYYPIVFRCLLDNRFDKLVTTLIKNNVDLHQLPDADPDKISEILFVCDPRYIDMLCSKHVKIVSSKEHRCRQIKERLKSGEVTRIIKLINKGALDSHDIFDVVSNQQLFQEIIEDLVNKLMIICTSTNNRDEVLSITSKYAKTVRFLLKNGLTIDECQMQNLLDMYLVDVVKVIILEKGVEPFKRCKVIPHKKMNEVKTAYMRQLFNDYNQAQLEDVFQLRKMSC